MKKQPFTGKQVRKIEKLIRQSTKEPDPVRAERLTHKALTLRAHVLERAK